MYRREETPVKKSQLRYPVQTSGFECIVVGQLVTADEPGYPLITKRCGIQIHKKGGGFVPLWLFENALAELRQSGKVKLSTKRIRIEGSTRRTDGPEAGTVTSLTADIDYTDLAGNPKEARIRLDEPSIREVEKHVRSAMQYLSSGYDHAALPFNAEEDVNADEEDFLDEADD